MQLEVKLLRYRSGLIREQALLLGKRRHFERLLLFLYRLRE